jgi:hypothetical protein
MQTFEPLAEGSPVAGQPSMQLIPQQDSHDLFDESHFSMITILFNLSNNSSSLEPLTTGP